MDATANNLSAHAKPWAPSAPGAQQQQQHGRSLSNQYSQEGGSQGGNGAMRGGMRSRGSGNNMMALNLQRHSPQQQDFGNTGVGMPMAMQQQQQQQAPRLSPTAAKLFVGQLPFECTEERLRNLFGAYGSVEHIHILRDNSNRSRGAAFITFSTVQEADTAIFTLHNRYRMLTNRAIQVSYAKNSPNISPFGTHSAVEVHQSNPTNPLPDVAGIAAQVSRLF